MQHTARSMYAACLSRRARLLTYYSYCHACALWSCSPSKKSERLGGGARGVETRYHGAWWSATGVDMDQLQARVLDATTFSGLSATTSSLVSSSAEHKCLPMVLAAPARANVFLLHNYLSFTLFAPRWQLCGLAWRPSLAAAQTHVWSRWATWTATGGSTSLWGTTLEQQRSRAHEEVRKPNPVFQIDP